MVFPIQYNGCVNVEISCKIGIMTPEENRFFGLVQDYAYRRFALWLNNMQLDAGTGLYMLTFSKPGHTRVVGIFRNDLINDASAGQLSEATMKKLDGDLK